MFFLPSTQPCLGNETHREVPSRWSWKWERRWNDAGQVDCFARTAHIRSSRTRRVRVQSNQLGVSKINALKKQRFLYMMYINKYIYIYIYIYIYMYIRYDQLHLCSSVWFSVVSEITVDDSCLFFFWVKKNLHKSLWTFPAKPAVDLRSAPN